MTVAAADGLSFDALAERLREHRRPWLEPVVCDELELGRIVESPDGLLRLRPEMFETATFAALAAWGSPAA